MQLVFCALMPGIRISVTSRSACCSRTAARAITPWWEWVRLMPSSLRRSHSTTTTPLERAVEAMCPRAASVSPRAR